jgi:hypothetical protein
MPVSVTAALPGRAAAEAKAEDPFLTLPPSPAALVLALLSPSASLCSVASDCTACSASGASQVRRRLFSSHSTRQLSRVRTRRPLTSPRCAATRPPHRGPPRTPQNAQAAARQLVWALRSAAPLAPIPWPRRRPRTAAPATLIGRPPPARSPRCCASPPPSAPKQPWRPPPRPPSGWLASAAPPPRPTAAPPACRWWPGACPHARRSGDRSGPAAPGCTAPSRQALRRRWRGPRPAPGARPCLWH